MAIVEALVEAGADPSRRLPATGFTPYTLAVTNGRSDVAFHLRDLAKVGMHDSLGFEGATLMDLTRRYGRQILGDVLGAHEAEERRRQRREWAREDAAWEQEKAERDAALAAYRRARREAALKAWREKQDAADREFLRQAELRRKEEALEAKRAEEERNRRRAALVRASSKKKLR